uniref:exodeoxyribonuclease III n=1 Tax=Astyanax mexicanus TaxID=7994 RepID=A0A3B1IKI8_ASTMX
MVSLNILSWNVRGLNAPIKRTRCLEFLHRNSVSIALLQESHLKREDILRFQNKNYKILANSSALNKSKGVLILIKRSVKLSVDLIGGDDTGRFVYTAVKINNIKLLLISIYAPNEFDQHFLDNIFKTLLQFNDYRMVLGADFNASVHPPLDRSFNDPDSPYPPSYLRLTSSLLSLASPSLTLVLSPVTLEC